MPVYLKNADLYKEIVLCLEQKELTPKAVNMFILLANELAKKLKYKDPMDKEDCIAYAIEDLLRYWNRFNPIYKNAFAYFTQIAKNGLAKGYKKIHQTAGVVIPKFVHISETDGIYNI
jgi:DNA-directed RNA polymerase specialized sigma subunit